MSMETFKDILVHHRLLDKLDGYFGDMLCRRAKVTYPEAKNGLAGLAVLAGLTVQAVRDGHSCLNVTAWCLDAEAWCEQIRKEAVARNQELPEARHKQENELPVIKELKDFEAMLATWSKSLDDTLKTLTATAEKPFAEPLKKVEQAGQVLVYLNRFYGYETRIVDFFRRYFGVGANDSGATEISDDEIHEASGFFKGLDLEEDGQQLAVKNCLKSKVQIITGGPGTGKTTVLATELALELQRNPELTIALCAPTGKAAARMKESVDRALADENNMKPALREAAVKGGLADLKPTTLHGLLGLHEGSDYPQRHHSNPLPENLVVVDECSMMSLQLFSQLLDALGEETRLILLGDPNQLASVDAGNVLAELCAQLGHEFVSRLTVNHRTKDNEALDRFARRSVGVEAGAPDVKGLYGGKAQANGALFRAFDVSGKSEIPLALKLKSQLLIALARVKKFDGAAVSKESVEQALKQAEKSPKSKGDKTGDAPLSYLGLGRIAEVRSMLKVVPDDMVGELMAGLETVRQWRKVKDMDSAFELNDSFKMLCAVREGAYGMLSMNKLMMELLGLTKPISNGVPIMILRNDANTGLKNGDIGVCFGGKVCFRRGGNTLCFHPMDLPDHEVAFAMTIHKSQGSDYKNVLMVLPDKDTPIMTRELVYTGITRTKVNFTLIAPKEILQHSLDRPIRRWSGLSARLKVPKQD